MTRSAQRLAADPKCHENVAEWVESNKKVIYLAYFILDFSFDSNFRRIKLARRFDCAIKTSNLV